MEKPPETGTKVVGCIAARQAAQSGVLRRKKEKTFRTRAPVSEAFCTIKTKRLRNAMLDIWTFEGII